MTEFGFLALIITGLAAWALAMGYLAICGIKAMSVLKDIGDVLEKRPGK
jgi:hypothetical protein